MLGGGSVAVAGVAGSPAGGVTLVASAAGAAVAAHGAVAAKNAIVNMVTGNGKDNTPTEPYKRPNNATTKQQRESVQDKPCVTCGEQSGKRVADHKTPLVKEHYETGKIDKGKMKDVEAVQPQCQTCSAKQGAEMSKYSKEQKKANGF